ncbi:MAG TPA: YwqJ-related putative deaminase, partial [Pedobacter sp.]|nr:YwqJ-related putative deaminase [Pedobacter sp.]
NWLFDVWLELKFGDPTGIKTAKSGFEQKYAVQTRQMSYHNDNVPQQVQTKLDEVNTNQANGKIIKGGANVVAFTIQTSAEISSNIVPLGEVVNLAARGLNLLKYSGKARSFAFKFAEEVIANTSKERLPRAITAILDRQTGKVYYGRSGVLKSVEDLNAQLKSLIPKESLEKWSVTNCAECDALNNALNDGAKIKDLEMHTLQVEKKTGKAVDFERCANCKETTKDIKTTSDRK